MLNLKPPGPEMIVRRLLKGREGWFWRIFVFIGSLSRAQGPVFTSGGAAEEQESCEEDASQAQGMVCLAFQGHVLQCWF